MVIFDNKSLKTNSRNFRPSQATIRDHNLASVRGAGRRQRRAAATRMNLYHAAIQLFAEKGFNNVTVEDITDAADVGKGTFFNYFPTKDHVLGVLVEIQLAKIREAVESAAGSRQSIRSVLHRLSLSLTEEPKQSPELARAVISAFLASKVVREPLQKQMVTGQNLIAELVGLGQAQGEIDPQLQRKAIAVQFQQMVVGTTLLWSLHGEPSAAKRVEDSFQHFWRAVSSRTREPKS